MLRCVTRFLFSNEIILLLSLDISNRAGRKCHSDITSNISPDRGRRGTGGWGELPVLLMYFDRTPQFDQINISNRDALSCYDTIWYGLREDFIHLFILHDCEREPCTCVFIICQSAFNKKRTCHFISILVRVYSVKSYKPNLKY